MSGTHGSGDCATRTALSSLRDGAARCVSALRVSIAYRKERPLTALMTVPGSPPPPPNWHSARLPINYEQAKIALANCERIDECAEWARKAEALASYYRQSVDQTLHNLALRIKLRAERRYGELLLEMDGSEEARAQAWEMARASGITVAQLGCAKRIAKLPTEQFERIVNQEIVPSLSVAVQKLGRSERVGRLRAGKANKEDFKEVNEFLWRLAALGYSAKESHPAALAAGIRQLWGKVDGQRHIEGAPNDIERMGLPEFVSRLSQFLAAVSKEYWKLEQRSREGSSPEGRRRVAAPGAKRVEPDPTNGRAAP